MPTLSQRLDLRYTLTFDAPFHFGVGLPSGLIDRAVRRDAAGFLVVPGSTIKGALREQCEHLARLLGQPGRSPHDASAALADFCEDDLVARIFGTRVTPSTVYFDDASLTTEWRNFFSPSPGSSALAARYRAWQVEERTQVSLSRLTRTARSGMLFSSEFGRKGLAFEGRVYGSIEDWPLSSWVVDAEGTFATVLLLASVVGLERLGSGRSSGLGACACTVTALTVDGQAASPEAYLRRLDYFDGYDVVKDVG